MKNLRTVLYTTIIIGLLFLGVNQLSIKSGILNSASSSILYPFLLLQNKIVTSIKKFFSNSDISADLESLVKHYKKENDYLQSQLIEFYAIKTYAQSIDELREFSERYNFKNYIVSQVLLKNFDSNQHFILIDAGSSKGVKEDMVVINKNCLVGKVSEVNKYYSKVILITDKSCKVAAYCVSNNVKGIHVGQNNLNKSILTFVNHLDDVIKDDLVLSSGEGTIFPRGFALGHISHAHKENFNYFVNIKPILDFSDLEYCCIIEKGSEIPNLKEFRATKKVEPVIVKSKITEPEPIKTENQKTTLPAKTEITETPKTLDKDIEQNTSDTSVTEQKDTTTPVVKSEEKSNNIEHKKTPILKKKTIKRKTSKKTTNAS